MADKNATVTQTLSPVSQTTTGTFAPGTSTATVTQILTAVTQTATATWYVDNNLATINQTLPLLVQTLTGSAAFSTLQDTVILSSVMVVNQDYLVEEVVLVGEVYSGIETRLMTNTVLADGTPTFEVVIYEEHTVTAWGGLLDSIQTTLLRRNTAQARDTFSPVSTVNLAETAVVTDSFLLTDVITSLRSTLYASSSSVTTGTLNQTLTASVWASGDSEYTLTETLIDTVTAVSVLVNNKRAIEATASTANASDTQTSVRTAFEELLGTADADNLIVIEGSTLNEGLSDTAVVSEFLIYQDPARLAWVLNPETAGLSYFDNFGFHSIAEYNGVLYATSNFGLYALDADSDAELDIDAEVKTGFLDMGSPQTKRISDIFVGHTGGQLKFDVETYDGPQEVYTYELEERAADAPRNNRLKVGRGLSSRYWRFAIRNTDGADFQLYDVTAEVASSKRRL